MPKHNYAVVSIWLDNEQTSTVNISAKSAKDAVRIAQKRAKKQHSKIVLCALACAPDCEYATPEDLL